MYEIVQEAPAGIFQMWDELEWLRATAQDLQAENESLRHELNIIKRYVEAKLGPIPPEEYFSESLKAYEKKRELSANAYTIASALNDQIKDEIIPAIESLKSRGSSSAGKTTAKRVKEIETLLKGSNGSLPFKTIRMALRLKPNQLSRLIASLDQRRFEVVSMPRAPREKVLRIKARWS